MRMRLKRRVRVREGDGWESGERGDVEGVIAFALFV